VPAYISADTLVLARTQPLENETVTSETSSTNSLRLWIAGSTISLTVLIALIAFRWKRRIVIVPR